MNTTDTAHEQVNTNADADKLNDDHANNSGAGDK